MRGRKGEYRRDFAELQKRGFQRVKVDGAFYEIGEVPALDKKLKHDIDVVVDRWSSNPISAIALPTNGSGTWPDRRYRRGGNGRQEKDDEDAERIIFSPFCLPCLRLHH